MNIDLRVRDFLGHILQASTRIEAFTVGMDKANFLTDLKTQDAVIRNMEVIGEACSNIRKTAPQFVQSNPQIPWGDAIGNRNALSHGYFSIDLELVWATTQTDVPALRIAVKRLHDNHP